MASYTDHPVTLLELRWIGSDDGKPPFNAVEVLWKGEVVPFVSAVTWKNRDLCADPTVVIQVVARCWRKRHGQADLTEWKEPIRIWAEMRRWGVRFQVRKPGWRDGSANT